MNIAIVGATGNVGRKILEVLEKKELMSIIRKNLLLLTPKEEKIIRLRFGIEEDINDVENFPVTEEMKRYLEK